MRLRAKIGVDSPLGVITGPSVMDHDLARATAAWLNERLKLTKFFVVNVDDTKTPINREGVAPPQEAVHGKTS